MTQPWHCGSPVAYPPPLDTKHKFTRPATPLLRHSDDGANNAADGWTHRPRSNQTPAQVPDNQSCQIKAKKAMLLVPMGHSNSRWSLLVPTVPPAKERKPPNAVCLVIVCYGQHREHKDPPLAPAVDQGWPLAPPTHLDQ